MSPALQVASFRDPAGRVVVLSDQVVRVVQPEAVAQLQAFLSSATAKRALADGRLVGTQALDDAGAQAVQQRITDHDVDAVGVVGGADALWLAHDKVPFQSYPYEWAPQMLEAAAALTLSLHDELVAEGLGLKDATPYNVLFDGPEPVFIDVLSVEKRDPHDPVWTPFGQFIRTFLLPLLARRDLGIPLADTFLANRDGLEPERVYGLTRPLRRLRRPYLSLVSLPTWLASKAESKGESLYEAKQIRNADQARFVLESASRRLKKHLKRLASQDKETSVWSEYMANRQHYADDDAGQKDQFVSRALADCKPEWVLDIGCNTGHFSRMAAEGGSRVVAVDLDPISVGRVWSAAKEANLDILPLVVNLSRPSPAVGWRNAECPSFLDRAEQRFDMVFFLAVMHHLHVTERIPLSQIVELAAHVSKRFVVFEYVGPNDPMFRHLLRGRGHLHEDLTQETFEQAARTRFHIRSTQPLGDSDRVLYLLERKGSSKDATGDTA